MRKIFKKISELWEINRKQFLIAILAILGAGIAVFVVLSKLPEWCIWFQVGKSMASPQRMRWKSVTK